eukprot:2485493-Heterocapsa_arctica.AAC.1
MGLLNLDDDFAAQLLLFVLVFCKTSIWCERALASPMILLPGSSHFCFPLMEGPVHGPNSGKPGLERPCSGSKGEHPLVSG